MPGLAWRAKAVWRDSSWVSGPAPQRPGAPGPILAYLDSQSTHQGGMWIVLIVLVSIPLVLELLLDKLAEL